MPKVSKKDTVTIIVSTAQIIFAKKGLSNTTMEDISIESGMGTASIYYYFKSEKKIFIRKDIKTFHK